MIRPLTETEKFFRECLLEMDQVNHLLFGQVAIMDQIVEIIRKSRDRDGRVFFCGVGRGAGNGANASGELFKSCNIKAFCLTDNVSVLTAIANDEDWSQVFLSQLVGWNMNKDDVLFVLSVGGGDEVRNISANIVRAIGFSKGVGAKVVGIVGRKEGFAAQNADAVIIVPTVNQERMTTHTVGMQAYILHFITDYLRFRRPKWEAEESAQTSST